jgi:hypothetical protein
MLINGGVMRVLCFLLFSGLALPVFAGNIINQSCCPTCQDWGLIDFNTVIYNPEDLALRNMLDCVVMQQRLMGEGFRYSPL